jgi:prolyl-tRNA synthetase
MNEAKLRAACGFDVHLADDALARESHFPVGFVGPHVAVGRDDVMLVIDHDAAQAQFWASGGNEIDHHVKHFNWQRDVLDQVDASRVKVADIRNAVEGDPSPKADGGVLRETKGIEIGHVFKLGTKYTQALDVTVLDENNQQRPVLMGCYGIGVNRILAAAIERDAPGNAGHDDKGIIWPASIAPYAVLITPIKFEGDLREAACDLAQALEQQGIDVLIDDRDERPGVKFNDADLIGIPVRVTIGNKALKDGKVEIKPRTAPDPELVPVADAPARIAELLATL